MKANAPSYRGYRFPPEIISHAVWLYHRFCLSFRDVEDLLAKRGILVSHETIRQWCRKFGPLYARRLARRRGRLGDAWHLDELFVTIRRQRQYLWRAVDEDGDTIDLRYCADEAFARDRVLTRDSWADESPARTALSLSPACRTLEAYEQG
jgi:transposase-like protein